MAKTNKTKEVKLSSKKNGHGYISSYTCNLGIAEVRVCGFFDENGESKVIEKIIDVENQQIILRAKK